MDDEDKCDPAGVFKNQSIQNDGVFGDLESPSSSDFGRHFAVLTISYLFRPDRNEMLKYVQMYKSHVSNCLTGKRFFDVIVANIKRKPRYSIQKFSSSYFYISIVSECL